ncbi:hypothetical protein C0991_004741 [Blastosporella zonata]|nr:hypothetical protein C0991_004741 [Blastosporella zonata]
MDNLARRSGRVNIRVGGNTQDTAVLLDRIPGGNVLGWNTTATGFRQTRATPLIYTPDILYMMANISARVNVHWFVGVPFLLNDTATKLATVQWSQEILGDHLMGLQVGNEVDLYQRHGQYTTYGPSDYYNAFGAFVDDMEAANLPGTNLLVGPNIAYAYWTAEDVWNTGFVSKYNKDLAYLSVEKYPTHNCAALFKHHSGVDPQTIFPDFLSHTGKFSGNNLVQKFINSTQFAVANGKRLVMMETNTASCGGFPGISDAFGAALWGIDYAFQMAVNNFGFAMVHIGGQSVSYNPFTPPPSSASNGWNIGPMYYTALVAAESIGPSNITQVIDLGANGGNEYTPAYAFYENGNPVRLGIINYVTDTTGASDLQVQIAIGIGQSIQSPPSVQVKYLLADSVSQKGNFMWAGQTFGDNFTSDGRPAGDEKIVTIACDRTTNLCTIPVPAPSYALVFLTGTAPTYGNFSHAISSGMRAMPGSALILALSITLLVLGSVLG